ncbi:MAG: hypothetical protein CMJ94_12990 [Planctomycetes bacterium]|nr:hypothetical protein [Planctomycetota bacterium]
MKRFLSIVLGAGFGALAGGALFTVLVPPLAGTMLAEQVVLAQFGAAVVALPLAALMALGSARSPEGSPARELSGFAIGFWIAAIPLFGVLISRLGEGPVRWGLPAVALALGGLGLTLLFGRRLTAPGPVRAMSAAGTAAFLAALFLGPAPNWFGWKSLPPIPQTLPAVADRPTEQVPDVVLVSIDTLRADAVVGPEAAAVPTLDALRERGTWAAWARSSSNCTVPGHTGMLFGMGALEHRVTVVYENVPPEPTTIAEVYRDHGYSTLALISNSIMLDGMGFERGFLEYDDSLLKDKPNASVLLQGSEQSTLAGRLLPRWIYRRLVYSGIFARPSGNALLAPEDAEAGQTNARALAWLDTLYAQEDPFFFFLHYIDPHAPYSAPEGFRGRHSTPQTPARSKERYLEEVEFSDHCLGEVVARMEASGRPYIICVTSDHGEHLGEHDLWGHTNSAFEELIRVPFVLAGPGVPQQELHEPHVADIAPTLLQLSGLPVPPDMSGLDLLGDEVPENRLHFARERKSLGIQQGPHKWTITDALGIPEVDEIALRGAGFLLDQDPREQQALSADAMPAGWLESVLATYAAAPEPIFNPYTGAQVRADRLAALRQMGYVDPRDEVKQAEKTDG